MKTLSKKKLKKYYARFYKTGEFRKIEAENEDEAYKIANEKFGDRFGSFTIGLPLRAGVDKVPINGILLKPAIT